jgi:hypothetical protein
VTEAYIEQVPVQKTRKKYTSKLVETEETVVEWVDFHTTKTVYEDVWEPIK